MQDGVLALNSELALASFAAKCEALNIGVFALLEDCKLRGVENKQTQVSLLDYRGFVALVASHTRQIAW